ncbi:MAG: sigma-70 family RNA polymerase sigma factor [Flavobacterium sp.]|nr:MAG: sigma-70 family RNA polymerase sigma factor [Flavobacterium sp.]
MGICLRYANNRLDAAGILNDSFYKVFLNMQKYDADKGFQPWLGKIVRHTAIDFYRANLKFAHHVDIDALDHPPPPVTDYDNLAYADLLKLIQSLSPAYRTVFNMFAIDGYGHEEIADVLKISIGTSKSNLFKARQKLQEMLLKHDQLSYKIQSSNEEKNCTQVRLDTNM